MQIYKTFEDLLKSNKSLFKLFSKSTNNGLLKAIWEAREAEINVYKEKIKYLQAKAETTEIELAEKKKTILFFEQEVAKNEAMINALSVKRDSTLYQVSFLEEEINSRDQKFEEAQKEIQKLKNYVEVLEKTLKMKDAEDNKTDKDLNVLEDNMTIAHQTIMELDHQNQLKLERIEWLEKELAKTQDALKLEKATNRQYKDLNFKMSNELYKLNHEVERLGGILE